MIKECLCSSWKPRIQWWTSMTFYESGEYSTPNFSYHQVKNKQNKIQKQKQNKKIRTLKLPCKINFGSWNIHYIDQFYVLWPLSWLSVVLKWPNETHHIKPRYCNKGQERNSIITKDTYLPKHHDFSRLSTESIWPDMLSVSQHTMDLWFLVSASPQSTWL